MVFVFQRILSVFLLLLLVGGSHSSSSGSRSASEATNHPNDDTDNHEDAAAAEEQYLEPEVHRYTNIVPREVCDLIIRLGEEAGFPLESDSIDDDPECTEEMRKDPQNRECRPNNRSQAIDVVTEEGEIKYPKIWEALEPYVPRMQELIVSQRDEAIDKKLFPDAPPRRVPRLGWIFYRKYSPGSARNALVPHFDSNLFTVNIALNDDFEGGGIFYVKPTIAKNPRYMKLLAKGDGDGGLLDPDAAATRQIGLPDLDDHQHTYEWVESLVKENSSDVVFPEMHTGDAMVYNYTVYHAVAPIQEGTRYSMVLFFDMDNPLLPDKDDEDEMEFWFEHLIKECDPETGKAVPIEDAIDVYWFDDQADELEIISKDLGPGEFDPPADAIDRLFGAPGSRYKVYKAVPEGETPTDLLAEVVLEEGRYHYPIRSAAQKLCEDDDSDDYDEEEKEDSSYDYEYDNTEDEEEEEDVEEIEAAYTHGIERCHPGTDRLEPFAIDIYWVDRTDPRPSSMQLVARGLQPGEVHADEAFAVPGERYRAYKSGELPQPQHLLEEIVIESGKKDYVFVGGSPVEHCGDEPVP